MEEVSEEEEEEETTVVERRTPFGTESAKRTRTRIGTEKEIAAEMAKEKAIETRTRENAGLIAKEIEKGKKKGERLIKTEKTGKKI